MMLAELLTGAAECLENLLRHCKSGDWCDGQCDDCNYALAATHFTAALREAATREEGR